MEEVKKTKGLNKYKLDKLRNNCSELFNVSTSTFDGATFNINKSEEYSITEIKNMIISWNKKEVK